MNRVSILQSFQKHTNWFLVLGAVFCILIFAGCKKPQENQAEKLQRTEGALWLQWTEGGYTRISSPGKIGETNFQYWTDQIRGTGLLTDGNDLYVAVNGLGVFQFNTLFSDNSKLNSKAVMQPDIFSKRTIGGFFHHGDRLYCHLYYNTVFHDPEPPSPPVALISFDSALQNLRLIPFRFQDENTGWELTTLYPAGSGEPWCLIWKKSDTEKTDFRYTLLDFDSWNETPTSREDLISRITPLEGITKEGLTKAPDELVVLIDSLKIDDRENTVIDAVLRVPLPGEVVRYRFGDSSVLHSARGTYLELSCFIYRGIYYVLDPRGAVIRNTPDGETERFHLPELPAGFEYYSFVTDGEQAVFLWEERQFTKVGSSGLFLSGDALFR